jgi:hypothetical protein
MTMRALFAGPAAARALVEGRDGVMELVLSRGAYARFGSEWLLLAEPSQPFGPLSVAVTGIDGLNVWPGRQVRVVGERLIVGNAVVGLERMRMRRALEVGSATPVRIPAVRAAAEVAAAGLPEPAPPLRDGIAALAAERVEEAVALLAGLGEGLTPAGDDVLAGYAAARLALGALPLLERGRAIEAPVLSTLAAQRSSGLGLAYLRAAERGELPDAAARLLGAICRGAPRAVRVAIPSLSGWGASSGVALGWGMTAPMRGRKSMQFNLRIWDLAPGARSLHK